MKYIKRFLVLTFLFASHSSVAGNLAVNQDTATLAFAGEHAGMAFDGVFEQWDATLVLPPESNPFISASFILGSAKTGDSTYDETLPEDDWFDIENYPTATFEASDIVISSGGYSVSGSLTLKGVTKPVEFMLEKSGNDLVADFPIDRIAFGIGVESDPDAEWVSRTIQLSLKINRL